MTVICVNNFNYGMTGGQFGPTTPIGARGTTAPYGNYENPFNLPYLAASSGAVYVARWTTVHVRRLKDAMVEAIAKPGFTFVEIVSPGFTFVEIVSPCPTNYGRRNGLGDGLEETRYYAQRSIIHHGADPKEADLIPGQEIVVGKFVERDRPTFLEMYEKQIVEKNKLRHF